MIRRIRPRRDDRPMDCREVARVLQVYLDGGLDRVPASRLEAHIEECRRCGLEAETYERIRTHLADRRQPVAADAVERLEEFGRRLAHGEHPLVD